EPFGFKPGGGFWPRNSVFYSGPSPEFSAARWELNDPDAEIISYEWSCYPDNRCLVDNPNQPSTTVLFQWDRDDFQNWALYLRVTAKRGDETIAVENFMEFSLEYHKCEDSNGVSFPCPWDVTGPIW
ncbi:MAG: hypothetical protein WBA45_07845, partial [Microthrixaceae bacterium]